MCLKLNEKKLQKIIDCESTFYNNFANCEKRNYGILYYNKVNPTSHDSNHAVFTSLPEDEAAINFALGDIARFYDALGLVPRIFGAYREGELCALQNALNENGFKIKTERNFDCMVLANESVISAPYRLTFERVRAIDDDVLQIYSEDAWNENGKQLERTEKVLAACVKHNDFHYLVGRLNGAPICGASIHFFEDAARIDSVETRPEFRGNGYCRELMRFVVRYFHDIGGDLLYLFSENPTAKKIYEEAGFCKIEPLEIWSAAKELAAPHLI